MLGDLLPLALLGGFLGLDVVSFPQAMLSRPLVAATLAGALLGQSLDGLLIGATLEMIALETLPFGASRYPEWGSASVVGAALFVTLPDRTAGSLIAGTIGALATAWVGGWTMVRLRKLNARRARRSREALEAGSRGAVIGLQLFGMSADLVRGALLTAIAFALIHPLARLSMESWRFDARLSRAVLVAVAASVGGAAVWKLFHGAPRARWLFVGGIVLGLVLMGYA